MKRVAIILAFIGLMTGLVTAVVGYNNSGGSDVGITSGSSAGATTGVSENGTEYSAKVEMSGRNSNQTDSRITNIDYSDYQRVTFEGTVTAGTPCHVIAHELNKTGDNSYTLNIQTARDELDNQACAEVLTGINYDATFEADSGFELEVMHNGETVETLEDRTVEKSPESGKSLIQRIIDLLGL